MKKLLLVAALGLAISTGSFAEESMDDKWVVNLFTKNTVHARVNGQITHGDGLHVRLVKDNCDMGNLLTFVYTYSNHPKIEQLKGSYVAIKIMGLDKVVKVLYAPPFLMGHRAIIDIGWEKIDKLKVSLSRENPLIIEFVDSKEIKITDYFDITKNSWSNDGVSGALDKAVKMCREL